jgi:hypothetical protein
MPRAKRTEICAAEEVQAFHLINRCVRRTYLCSNERRSGRDFTHRKEWVRQRLEELAGITATPETIDFNSVRERIKDRASAAEVTMGQSVRYYAEGWTMSAPGSMMPGTGFYEPTYAMTPNVTTPQFYTGAISQDTEGSEPFLWKFRNL